LCEAQVWNPAAGGSEEVGEVVEEEERVKYRRERRIYTPSREEEERRGWKEDEWGVCGRMSVRVLWDKLRLSFRSQTL
jgi:hypothetical protein